MNDLVPTDFELVESLTGRKFSAGVTVAGKSLATDWSSHASFLKSDVSGKHCWINCREVDHLRMHLDHFLECRRKAPTETSACLLLSHVHAVDRRLLKGWKVVLNLPKGSVIRVGDESGEGFSEQRSVRMMQVLYYAPSPDPRTISKSDQNGSILEVTREGALDDPERRTISKTGLERPTIGNDASEHSENELVGISNIASGVLQASKVRGISEGLTMLFGGIAAGTEASILFDSGASHNYVSKSFVALQGISVDESMRGDVLLGDNRPAGVAGIARVFVKLGAFQKPVQCLVMAELLTGVDVILGDAFMRAHKVVLDYDKLAFRMKKGNRRITVSRKPPARDVPSVVPSEKLLSAMQVKRLVRKGNKAFLAVVQEIKPDIAPSDSDEDPCHVKTILDEYADIFTDELPAELPPTRNVGHSIPTEPGHVPPFRPMYRLSPMETREAKEQITKLLEKGLIEPSTSPYGAPILFVPKPNGRGLRMCLDLRALNSVTIKNRYPLPRIDDLLDKITGASYFTSLDLTAGYHQIRITDEDVPKTAFRTPFGHFQFKVLTFGLTNAPATFQAVMNDIFRPYLDDFVVVYLDDILIYSKSAEEHERHLRLVLDVLRREKFYAALPKCDFAKQEIKFLGHIVGKDGIKVNPEKVAAVERWEPPRDVHQVRSFLGLANFFRRFIQGYSTLVAPLTDLTKSGKSWNWTKECHNAFEGVKWALTHTPVLRSPDESKRYEVVSDASTIGIGAVLLQDHQPVAFHSRKLSAAEKNYTTTEQELLGVVDALRVWRCYLEGVEFDVVTDHCPNTFFQTQPNLSRRQARWSEFLQRFDFQWRYRPGRTNVADPLSRNPIGVVSTVLFEGELRNKYSFREGPPEDDGSSTVFARSRGPSDLPVVLQDAIRRGYANDTWLRDANSQGVARLSVNSVGLFLHDDKVYVPNDVIVKRLIWQELHDAKYSGHFGVSKTRKAVEQLFWWPKLREETEDYVRNCPTCQYDKAQQLRPAGLLQPLPIPGKALGLGEFRLYRRTSFD